MPQWDLTQLLRFFERVEAARRAGALYPPLLVELVGRHAAWWMLAINPGRERVPTRALADLGRWADEYAARYKHKYHYLDNWGANRRRDFDLDFDFDFDLDLDFDLDSGYEQEEDAQERRSGLSA